MAASRFFRALNRMTSPCRDIDCSRGVVLKNGILFYLVYGFLAFLIVVTVLFISKLTGLEIKNVMSTDVFKESVAKNPLLRLSQICLLGPLLEEIVFRLWLSFKRLHLGIAVFTISCIVLTKLVLPNDHDVYLWGYQSDYFEHVGLKILIPGLLASSVLLLKESRLSNLGDRTKHIIIYFSLFCFAALHLTNIICPWYLYPLMLIMCLPQLILGATATYFRLQLGFWAGWAFHGTVNLCASLVAHWNEIVSLFG